MTRQRDGAALPGRSVVYVCPGLRCDIVPYVFYTEAPDGYLLDVRHVAVDSYAPSVGRDLLRFAAELPDVNEATVERVVVGGSAFSLGFTWNELLLATDEASRHAGVPVIMDMSSVVAGLRNSGCERVAVAHRLAGVGDAAIAAFLESAGFDCAAVVSAAQDVATNAATPLREGAGAAADLAQRAMDAAPGADAVLLLGGTWWSGEAERLVRATNRHFFNNVTAVAHDLPPLRPAPD